MDETNQEGAAEEDVTEKTVVFTKTNSGGTDDVWFYE